MAGTTRRIATIADHVGVVVAAGADAPVVAVVAAVAAAAVARHIHRLTTVAHAETAAEDPTVVIVAGNETGPRKEEAGSGAIPLLFPRTPDPDHEALQLMFRATKTDAELRTTKSRRRARKRSGPTLP